MHSRNRSVPRRHPAPQALVLVSAIALVASIAALVPSGVPDVARYAGTLTSPVMSNPQLNSSCKAKRH